MKIDCEESTIVNQEDGKAHWALLGKRKMKIHSLHMVNRSNILALQMQITQGQEWKTGLMVTKPRERV